MSAPYRKGALVWIPETPTSWVPGTIISVEASCDDPSNEAILSLSHDADPSVTKTIKLPLSSLQDTNAPTLKNLPGTSVAITSLLPLRNPASLGNVEDLANLSNLNEPSGKFSHALLHAIATRYMQHLPYTYSGIVLLSVNPFTPLNIYDNAFVKLYSGQKKGQQDPHVFAIAEEALDALRRGKGVKGVDPAGAGDQTIVVSGESGAGKTVAAKYILRYFASATHVPLVASEFETLRKNTADEESMSEVEGQILASNPIMEAFGNAKTTRNDNSSRFGKYIQVLFNDGNEIVGAHVRTYLLERSRLVYQPALERNYHIFYQLLAGAPSQERKDLALSGSPGDFAYLSGGGPSSITIAGVDDAKDFTATQQALSTVGISVERQWRVFKLLAALLHLGNAEIIQTRTDALLDETDVNLIRAAELLGLPLSDFRRWIIKKQLVTRNEKIITSLAGPQAIVVRDSVAKFIYSCLFQWLVNVINESLSGEGIRKKFTATNFIGVLDIYGFEHFAKNSFEQFCINWANEKLQQEFYARVFRLEQDEYLREKIDWAFISFTDNQACIDVIEGKMGILSLLDEESRLPAGSDVSFATKLHQQLPRAANRDVFKKPRFNERAFTVAHYAHDVTYDVDGFVEKNRDTVPDQHLDLLQNSDNEFLREVVNAAMDSSSAKQVGQQDATATSLSRRTNPRKPTLGSIFKSSLVELMTTIYSTNVHYIRCIKPNEAKKAWELDSIQVLAQLRACGVLETIRISCAGYPSRWEFNQFAQRYLIMLHSQEWRPDMDVKQLCSAILTKVLDDENQYQLGLTKIFFRPGVLALLESLRSAKQHELVSTIQKYIRRFLALKHYNSYRMNAVTIQTWWRGILAQRLYTKKKHEKMALLLQTVSRRWLAMRRAAQIRESIIRAQSLFRAYLARNLAQRTRILNSTIMLQSLFRGFSTRRHYQEQIQRVIVIQSLWRRKAAANELQILKHEAKSARKFKEISYQLENKVVELTRSLQNRIAENRELSARITSLEEEIVVIQRRNRELVSQFQDREEKLIGHTVPKPDYDLLQDSKREAEFQLSEATKKVLDQEARISELNRKLDASTQELAQKEHTSGVMRITTTEDHATVDHLRSELEQLREAVSRGSALNTLTYGRPRSSYPSPTGSNRLQRRHSIASRTSYASDPVLKEDSKYHINPRSVSFMWSSDGTPLTRELRDSYMYPATSVSEEVARLLEDEAALNNDVLQGLVHQLKIPNPSLHAPPVAKEVLFPAHLISLICNEMWKHEMMEESERLFANMMQAVQQHVLTFKGEDIIIPGIFWLSNVQEILSFICLAEDVTPKAKHDWERLIGVIKHDLDSLEYNIYHSFMLEIKRKLSRMIVPALIESQSLPGFITSDSGRLFSRMLEGIGGVQQPTFSMEDILNLLNRVWKCLKSYYMEESVMHQVVTELLKLIGQISFNDLIMRRNFCSWKRGIYANSIQQWCKSHDMPEGLLQLEHLMQATKLLQLKKATLGDIDILFDVCWILSPTQVQKLISQYHIADYEAPLKPEILRAVAARVKPEDRNDQLLLTPETEEVGPYQLPPPREIAGLETYVPAWLNVPSVRRLAAFVA
uniref:MYO2 n=1 Tax=Cryptococcus neoformans TaxID=5207 RepID=Q8J110_CRYNE|nr:MYO2 [Cryptococcus neoformans var. grubii]